MYIHVLYVSLSSSPSLFLPLSLHSVYRYLSPPSLFLLSFLPPLSPPPSISVSLSALLSSGLTGPPVARLVGREGDTERPSTSLSVSRPTFALSTGLKRVSVKHLVSLIRTSMAVRVCVYRSCTRSVAVTDSVALPMPMPIPWSTVQLFYKLGTVSTHLHVCVHV